MGKPDELVDIVDEDDQVIDTVPRRRMRAEVLRHRSVAIVVVDSRDRLLVHRRALDKDVWPGRWDLAAGGVVAAGETYSTAARRELAEELGIDDCPLTDLGAGVYTDESVSAIYRAYLARWDGPISFDDGEVVEARWVGRSELDTLLATESFVPDSISLFVAILPALFEREVVRDVC